MTSLIKEGHTDSEGYDLWRHHLTSLIKGHTDSEGYDLWQHQLTSLVKGHTDSEGYDLCRHQLTSLIKAGHTDKDIFDAIRSPLHGKAGNVIVRLGTEATVQDIL